MVYSYIEPLVEEIHPEDEAVSIKGKLRMCAVIKNGDEPAYGVEKIVGFEEKFDFEGVSDSMHLIPELTVTSLKANVNANDTGCEVVLSGIVEMCAIGEENQQVELIVDGYFMECDTDNSYDNFEYTRLSSVSPISGNHSTEINRADIDSEGMREVVFLTSALRVEEIEKEDGKITVHGEVRYNGVASEMIGDKISYTGLKFSSPFSINVNCDCQNDEKIQVEVELHTKNTNVSLDADKLYAECTIDGRAVILSEENERILSSMRKIESNDQTSTAAKITVYYPSAEDTLFTVAKRFRTSKIKLARDNDITESVFASDNPGGSLKGIKKLIVY